MNSYIGLLRAVNLGPHNKIGMADLRSLLEGLELQNVRTLLQSGNVVFHGDGSTAAQLERTLEHAIARRLGVETDVFVRTASEWQGIVDANPFPKEAKIDPSHLLAVILKEAVDPGRVTALQKTITGREVVRAKGRCAYVVYPDGIGRSRLTSAVIEKGLATHGTARNWNTVLKLQALVETP